MSSPVSNPRENQSHRSSGYLAPLSGYLSNWSVTKIDKATVALSISFFLIGLVAGHKAHFRFNATWLKNRSSFLSIPVYLGTLFLSQAAVAMVFSPIGAGLNKMKIQKMEKELKDIREKIGQREKKEDSGKEDLQTRLLSIQPVKNLSDLFVFALKKKNTNLELFLTIALTKGGNYRVMPRKGENDSLIGLSFDTFIERLNKIIEGEDEEYILSSEDGAQSTSSQADRDANRLYDE